MLYPEEVDYWDAEIMQISVYHGIDNNIDMMRRSADACREAGIRYVLHPVKYSLLQDDMMKDMRTMAETADLALIIHDERSPEGERLEGEYEARFRNALEELQSISHVSIENAAHTGDIRWFWNNFADSITLDIGHVEVSGFDSVKFVESLDEESVSKLQYVHMHKNNGLHGGITDHWPLSRDCREIRALEGLLKIKSDVSVILEVNEIEEINNSLDILKSLRDRLFS